MKHTLVLFISVAGIVVVSSLAILVIVSQYTQLNIPLIANISAHSGLTITAPTAPVRHTVLQNVVRVDDAKLVPVDDITLSFLDGGIVARIDVEEGDLVEASQELIRLNSTDLDLARAQANTLLQQRISELDRLIAGERDENLRILEDEKTAAATALLNDEVQLLLALEDAYTIGSEAVLNTADEIFRDARTIHPDLTVTVRDYAQAQEIERTRVAVESLLKEWDASRTTLAAATLDQQSDDTNEYIHTIQHFLNLILTAINEPNNEPPSNTYEGALYDALNVLDAQVVAIEELRTQVETSRDTLTIASSTLSAREAKARSEDVIIAEQRVEEARKQVARIDDEIQKSRLFAPEKGTMTVKKIHVEVDETILSGTPALLIASSDLEIEVDIPEEDIGAIREGVDIAIVLKSFPDMPLSGIIERIEAQEIIESGSTYFRARATLNTENIEGDTFILRSGMTGDVFITTLEAREVLAIPKTATYQKDGQTFVQVVHGNNVREVPVIPGIADTTHIEILEGLEEGQQVVQFP